MLVTIKFNAVIRINDINPYVDVSAVRARAIHPGWRRPMPVRFWINGEDRESWRINMMPKGDGSFFLYLHGGVRKSTRTKVGDRVALAVEFDDKYKGGPVHPVPTRFKAALTKTPKAKKAWDALIPSRKKEILRYFANLKSPEAKERNYVKTIDALSGGKARYMGRIWNV